jgi:GPH family glycoside/pentoside/hexuronide:cation symporter
MVQGLFISSLMPDICDIDELTSGERREGLFASMQTFVSKLENSICALLSMWLLSLSGFNANLDHQPPEVISRWFWWGFTPGIVCSAINLVIVWHIPVTEEMMKDVRAKLEKRRAEAAAATKRSYRYFLLIPCLSF